jgi:hypothetical protein
MMPATNGLRNCNRDMDENNASNELSVGQMIQLELCAIEAVITALEELAEEGEEPLPALFYEVRDRLISLLDQLFLGEIQPEPAEVQLEQIQETMRRWRRDNPIPPYHRPT